MNDLEKKGPLPRERYEEAIRRSVCERCIDLGSDGICHTRDPQGCAVFRFLPELVSIAERVHAQKMEPYLEEVRSSVCAKCGHEQPRLRCEVREELDCALDRYLALVFDALDESAKTRDNPSD